MWDTPRDEKTGFYWRENMSVKAILTNYDKILLSIKGKAKTEQDQATNGKQSPAVRAGYTDYTNSEPVKFIRLDDRKKVRA